MCWNRRRFSARIGRKKRCSYGGVYVPVYCAGGRLVREGLALEEVLGLLTLSPVAHLGLSSGMGSLEEGKRGDLVLWDGDPFAYTSGVVATVIEGTVVYRKK